jgi:hypothetical protein
MRAELRTTCETAEKKGGRLDRETCVNQLIESVNLYPRTTIVLDGLDECDENHREIILNAVERLFAESKNPLKVLIASRPTQDLQRQFDHGRDFQVETSDNIVDIRTYVHQAIQESKKWKDVSIDTKERVAKGLIEDRPGEDHM